MTVREVSNFERLLESRRGDFPQVIVAGWMLPNGQPVGAHCNACDKTPTEGEMMAAYACCLKAVLLKIEEVLAASTDEQREALMQVINVMCDGMEVVKRFRGGLVSQEALAGAVGPLSHCNAAASTND